MTDPLEARSGVAAVDRYLAEDYRTVPGMSSRFAAAITCGLMRIQSRLGVTGDVAEIGAFEGRFLIALAHALAPGERALGIDRFDWPTPAVLDRFEENCRRHAIAPERRITWKADTAGMRPQDVTARLGGGLVRLFHIDGEHTRAALTHDLELATPVMCDGGILVLDDMLHPGYPTLVLAVHEYLQRYPEMTVLCIIDRESVVAASKFVLCGREWFERYEAVLLEDYKANIWPMGANFEPHWCLVLSLDTALPDFS
ncbi:MAG: class I SAM-dependent methyltransferase [Hyphomicrobiaceae bacterium]|nr:class I SAM-dependent methyltransferase [Hyphomicrobiaceae bacterium]